MSASLTFGGNETFSAPPEQVFAALTDLDRLPSLIPDLVSAEKVDDRTLNCVVRPGFSFLRGTLRMTIEIVDRVSPKSASMKVSASGMGAQIEIASSLEIAPKDSGSALTWSATVTELKGLVATISRPLISAAADQVIRKAWQRLHAELATPNQRS
jgi:carbon monoxide dehydrogenase subunit G